MMLISFYFYFRVSGLILVKLQLIFLQELILMKLQLNFLQELILMMKTKRYSWRMISLGRRWTTWMSRHAYPCPFDHVFWSRVLISCFDHVFWSRVLVTCSDHVFWARVLPSDPTGDQTCYISFTLTFELNSISLNFISGRVYNISNDRIRVKI